jgi:hypothetical protein
VYLEKRYSMRKRLEQENGCILKLCNRMRSVPGDEMFHEKEAVTGEWVYFEVV